MPGVVEIGNVAPPRLYCLWRKDDRKQRRFLLLFEHVSGQSGVPAWTLAAYTRVRVQRFICSCRDSKYSPTQPRR